MPKAINKTEKLPHRSIGVGVFKAKRIISSHVGIPPHIAPPITQTAPIFPGRRPAKYRGQQRAQLTCHGHGCPSRTAKYLFCMGRVWEGRVCPSQNIKIMWRMRQHKKPPIRVVFYVGATYFSGPSACQVSRTAASLTDLSRDGCPSRTASQTVKFGSARKSLWAERVCLEIR